MFLRLYLVFQLGVYRVVITNVIFTKPCQFFGAWPDGEASTVAPDTSPSSETQFWFKFIIDLVVGYSGIDKLVRI